MFERLQNRRLIVMMLALLVGFAGLVCRLVDLQVFRHDELQNLALDNISRETVREPGRGNILDRNGNPLATSLSVNTVVADPTLISNRFHEVAMAIGPLLGRDVNELCRELDFPTMTNSSGQVILRKWVKVQSNVTDEDWVRVKTAMKNLDFGIDESRLSRDERIFYRQLRRDAIRIDPAEAGQMRVYPNGTLAAHVLGFVGNGRNKVNGQFVNSIDGKEGIEFTLDQQLGGVAGWRLTEKVRGRELVTARSEDVEPRDGLNAVLTIDSVLQLILESEMAEGFSKHKPESVCGVIVKPKTGEILALATLPNFDPAKPGESPAASRRNRMIADVIEPGSTFKIVVVSGALNDRKVSLSSPIDCQNGAFRYGGRTLHDHDPYGVLSVKEIITKSSNIGAAKIGILLGPERLQEHILNFGFGSRTGVPLPGEVAGIVHPVKNWSKVTIAQLPMGQGIAVTRMQMTMAMCAMANKGLMMRPMLVDRLVDQDGRLAVKYAPQPAHQVISPQAAADMVQALKTVVQKGGTATGAALEHYAVAGKTGTAQKAGPGGYMPGKYVSSFIGFLPADNPEICIGIFFDEPHNGHYGGVTAGPVFKRVAERAAAYLGLPVDDPADGSTRELLGTVTLNNQTR